MAVAKPWLSDMNSRISDIGVGRDDSTSPITLSKSKVSSASNLRASCCMRWFSAMQAMCMMPIAAIARGQQDPRQQRRTDAVRLPALLDADRGFRFACKAHSERTQFGGGPHHIVEEEGIDDAVERIGELDIFADEVIGYAAGEFVSPAFGVEAEDMIAIFRRLADPQFADHAAFGKNFLHSSS